MEAVVGLLLLLVGATQGTETFCDSRQDKAQCYGADGGTVFIQLINEDTETDNRFEWRKDDLVLLRGRKKSITYNLLENRSSFSFNNGTFMIKNLSKSDSGEYKLTLFNSDGKITEKRTTWFTVNVHTDPSVLRCSLMFLFSVVSFVGIGVYFKWKKIKSEKPEQFAARNRRTFSEDFSENEQTLSSNI